MRREERVLQSSLLSLTSLFLSSLINCVSMTRDEKRREELPPRVSLCVSCVCMTWDLGVEDTTHDESRDDASCQWSEGHNEFSFKIVLSLFWSLGREKSAILDDSNMRSGTRETEWGKKVTDQTERSGAECIQLWLPFDSWLCSLYFESLVLCLFVCLASLTHVSHREMLYRKSLLLCVESSEQVGQK